MIDKAIFTAALNVNYHNSGDADQRFFCPGMAFVLVCGDWRPLTVCEFCVSYPYEQVWAVTKKGEPKLPLVN
ncbi:MAG: hypothetical protein ABW094_09970 [Candidatus Thiodiazotropha sp.]